MTQTKQPPANPGRFIPYQDAAWLIRDYALTTLPSVGSLRSLREFGRDVVASRPFVGFGDPVLGMSSDDTRGIAPSSLFRGNLSDVEALRDLPSLPETADELRMIASFLGVAGENDTIFLGDAATEARVKTMDLSDRRVIVFATHGLVSGELKGLSEPALVLTPPEVATKEDDGLLTASEVAQLKLNADWIILSACNTAAGSRLGAKGLSGLAQAFFYAGARSLLVSHWPVASVATTDLVTGMFGEIANDEGIGRSQALQRAQLAMIANDNNPSYAHPLFWAPFVIVGEGGR